MLIRNYSWNRKYFDVTYYVDTFAEKHLINFSFSTGYFFLIFQGKMCETKLDVLILNMHTSIEIICSRNFRTFRYNQQNKLNENHPVGVPY